MSSQQSVPPATVPPRQVGMAGLVAAAIIGLQSFGCAAFAVVFLLAAPEGASLSDMSHLMFSAVTALFAIGLGFVARGLSRGLSWPRAATVVWLVLLLPVGLAMLQAGRGVVGVLILGSSVAGIVAVTAESSSARQT